MTPRQAKLNELYTKATVWDIVTDYVRDHFDPAAFSYDDPDVTEGDPMVGRLQDAFLDHMVAHPDERRYLVTVAVAAHGVEEPNNQVECLFQTVSNPDNLIGVIAIGLDSPERLQVFLDLLNVDYALDEIISCALDDAVADHIQTRP